MKNSENKKSTFQPVKKKPGNAFFLQNGEGDFFSGNGIFGGGQSTRPFFTPSNPVQRVEVPQEEETTQLKSIFESEQQPIQKVSNNSNNTNQNNANQSENNTGMPDDLKAGVEGLSGLDMSDVKVHYNSDKPAQLQAHAYAQGTDIHLAPGEEKHLPHETWHVVQQKQGRVKPTIQMKGKVDINEDAGLEKEADEMGEKALQMKATDQAQLRMETTSNETIQRVAKNDNPNNYKAQRSAYFPSGRQNQYDSLREKIGTENINLINDTNLILAVFEKNKGDQLANVVLGLNATADVQALSGIFAHLGANNFRAFLQLPVGFIQDYIDPQAPRTVSNDELAVLFNNYLRVGGFGGFQANRFATFVDHYNNQGNYYNFATNNFVSLHDDYKTYLESTLGGGDRVRYDAFAGDLFTGKEFQNNTLSDVNGWQNDMQRATRRQIDLINTGIPLPVNQLPSVPDTYSGETDTALQTIDNHRAAVRARVGNSHPKMRTLIRYLKERNEHQILNVDQDYQNVFGHQIIDHNHIITPLYSHQWEAAFVDAVDNMPANRGDVINYANIDSPSLNRLRVALHGIDGANAPNLTNLLKIIGKTQNNNPGRVNAALEHLASLNTALPNADNFPNNLPFGNRAGGLSGHFKKHVLGVGNIDLAEPPLWLAALNLGITRADFGNMRPMDERDMFVNYTSIPVVNWYKFASPYYWRQQSSEQRGDTRHWNKAGDYFRNRVNNADTPNQAKMLAYFQGGGIDNDDPYAVRLAALYQNNYDAYVSNAFDHATHRYVYFSNERVFINAYQGTNFIVASYVNGQFDFSSGYKPQVGGQGKYNNERPNRFWEI